jgi:hypothetical protein
MLGIPDSLTPAVSTGDAESPRPRVFQASRGPEMNTVMHNVLQLEGSERLAQQYSAAWGAVTYHRGCISA